MMNIIPWTEGVSLIVVPEGYEISVEQYTSEDYSEDEEDELLFWTKDEVNDIIYGST